MRLSVLVGLRGKPGTAVEGSIEAPAVLDPTAAVVEPRETAATREEDEEEVLSMV